MSNEPEYPPEYDEFDGPRRYNPRPEAPEPTLERCPNCEGTHLAHHRNTYEGPHKEPTQPEHLWVCGGCGATYSAHRGGAVYRTVVVLHQMAGEVAVPAPPVTHCEHCGQRLPEPVEWPPDAPPL